MIAKTRKNSTFTMIIMDIYVTISLFLSSNVYFMPLTVVCSQGVVWRKSDSIVRPVIWSAIHQSDLMLKHIVSCHNHSIFSCTVCKYLGGDSSHYSPLPFYLTHSPKSFVLAVPSSLPFSANYFCCSYSVIFPAELPLIVGSSVRFEPSDQ